MTDFSFVLLTYNEEIHLPRLLHSVKELKAPVYVLDSGSTDRTILICEELGAIVKYHPFQNHPKQWEAALNLFDIQTPWIIGLDADQYVTPELFETLRNFRNEDYADVNGIYFNRKYFLRGQWIRYGGFYPKYLLKMFRRGIGFSDTNENMDHRFVVPGKTIIWKQGHIIEENFKENEIGFWIAKHNRYSDLVADEEVERQKQLRSQTVSSRFFGNPDERIAWLKNLWWRLPLGLRPFLYFSYRMFFRLGFLDGKTGMLFHFLQGFWFRLIVDVKIKERLKVNHDERTHKKSEA
jgi:glycosyltransferase involved in cell wall biosynthesis